MSNRSDYSDSLETWQLVRWRGAVASAIRGKRGQAFLKELLQTLDALPEKKLCYGELKNADGMYCAIGSIAANRGIDLSDLDIDDHAYLAGTLDIADALVREIEHINDEYGSTPEQRFNYMRKWCVDNIKNQ